MSFTSTIADSVKRYPELKIIDARQIHKEKFSEIPEQAFYQVVSRMAKAGEIERLTKGIYCRPKSGRFGKILSSEKDILEHYLGKNKKNGIVIGYRMYTMYGLTTQLSKDIQMNSNIPLEEKRQIRNVSVKKADLRFDASTKKLIELLEVLQHHKEIEDLNYKNLWKFLSAASEHYNENKLGNILGEIKYKKSTLASLKNVLDHFGVSNTVGKYLKGTSKYDALDVEKIYEATPESTRF
mgnify:FL=1|jgi:hypothetical protein